jgi:transcription elongation GreA/GreB family factor
MNDLNKQKLEMWKKKLEDLHKRYEVVMIRRGEAIQMGDLRENAAFQDADEESAVVRQQITEVEKIISKIEAQA